MKTAKLTTKDEKTQQDWLEFCKTNQDDYSWCAIEAIEKLGANLDAGMSCQEAGENACKDSDLTVYLAGWMAKAIAHLHPRGEEFRLYWNGLFSVPPEIKGVVRPALWETK